MATSPAIKIAEALSILKDIGMPRAQQNERSALCLLSLADVRPTIRWAQARDPLMGITPIMDWAKANYGANYAPNTRETFRRQTMHQFVAAGIALYNPDDPKRPVNSPQAVYQLTAECLELLRQFGSNMYQAGLQDYLSKRDSLAKKYARLREMSKVPLLISGDQEVKLSPGVHSELIRAIYEEFAPRFVPGGELIYAGDTGDKWGYFDKGRLGALGVEIDNHGKMPDVVIYCLKRNWLILAEAVTSHGPVDPKRHEELAKLFASSKAGLVFVSAFPNRRIFLKYLEAISWETEVWLASDPTHLVHFNGARFLGPHDAAN